MNIHSTEWVKDTTYKVSGTLQQWTCICKLLGSMTPEEARKFVTYEEWNSVGSLWDCLDDLLECEYTKWT